MKLFWERYKAIAKLAWQYPERGNFKAVHMARLTMMLSFVAIWSVLVVIALIFVLIF